MICFSIVSNLKLRKFLGKNQNGFWKPSTTSQIWTICQIIEGVRAKYFMATLLFVDFSKASDFIHWGKMEQMLLAYVLPKETITAIMLCKNMKAMVCSPDSDTNFFIILTRVLQGDILVPYIYIYIYIYNLPLVCTSNINRPNKRK